MEKLRECDPACSIVVGDRWGLAKVAAVTSSNRKVAWRSGWGGLEQGLQMTLTWEAE